MRSWRRVPSLISIFLLAAGAASGCRDRVFDFGYQITDPDAGGVDAPVIDGPTDHHVTPDLTGFGGSGNSAGTGGRGGGSGTGGSGGGGSGGTGGSVPTCSNTS